jgi:hypothetical protein
MANCGDINHPTATHLAFALCSKNDAEYSDIRRVCVALLQRPLEKPRNPSEISGAAFRLFWRRQMTIRPTITLAAAAVLTAMATSALAQAPAPTPWVLAPDMGYGYDTNGKTFSYKMGTNNAKFLLKGAKKVPKNTLFFIGENGQLYMRSGPFLEDDGRFKFGPG